MSKQQTAILLVEDNPGDIELLNTTVFSRAEELDVVAVSDLAAAAVAVTRRQFDLVLLDLTLPDSRGLDTIRKATSLFPRLPIIVLTGEDDDQLGLDAIQAGAQDYLVKGSADARSIVRAVRYAIFRSRAEESLRQKAEELRRSNKELEVMNKAMVGRELRMMELKKEVDKLLAQSGQPSRYGHDVDGHYDPGAVSLQ